ncbi:MAG: endonuclease/exonuclease/phosphatase family protein [Phycisphaerales bacterium JB060]
MLDAFLWWLAISMFGPLAVLTITPLVWDTGKWFVRAWDFPRLQLAALTILPAIVLLGLMARGSGRAVAASLIVALLAFAVSGLIQMLPFSRFWRKEVPALTGEASSDSTLTILVANICYESDQYEKVADAIRSANPDLLLLIEVNETWRDSLERLAERFPHRVESISGEGLGLALWSQRELRETHIDHIVSERRPSIFADVNLADGRSVRFVGLHPTPPGLRDSTGEERRDSRVRDSELVLLARHIADNAEPNWIVAGDFNDVAWSHTTRLFKRLSGLLDPRVGRKLLNTFHARFWWLRFPVDHLFIAPGFRIGNLERVRLPGSDHFGVLATLQLEAKAEAEPPEPNTEEGDEEEAEEAVEEGVEDARERSVEVSNPGVAAA